MTRPGVPQSYKELADLAMAQHKKTYPESPLTSLKYTKHEAPVAKKGPKAAASSPKPQAATNPEEVKRRRYTVFLRYRHCYLLTLTPNLAFYGTF